MNTILYLDSNNEINCMLQTLNINFTIHFTTSQSRDYQTDRFIGHAPHPPGPPQSTDDWCIVIVKSGIRSRHQV